jgi:hypothetical protein
MRDANLAEHLRGEVDDGQSLVIARGAQLRPVAHRIGFTTALHFALQRG